MSEVLGEAVRGPVALADRSTVSEIARAKVNLHLHVLGRRPDGYHLLDSLVAFVDACDTLTGTPAAHWSLAVSGPMAAGLAANEANLVLRAARALEPHGARPTRLHLHKALPIASGVGGGSADAAAALRLLARLWDLDVDLPAIGATLGADVPVCLASRPMRMGGIGEMLADIPALPQCGVALVNPGIEVATPAVFARRAGPFSTVAALSGAWDDVRALVADLAGVRNDLEVPARRLAPAIAGVLLALERTAGCRLARMSGSGATCFGLFDSAEAAASAAATLRRPGWWAWGGGMALPDPPVAPLAGVSRHPY